MVPQMYSFPRAPVGTNQAKVCKFSPESTMALRLISIQVGKSALGLSPARMYTVGVTQSLLQHRLTGCRKQ